MTSESYDEIVKRLESWGPEIFSETRAAPLPATPFVIFKTPDGKTKGWMSKDELRTELLAGGIMGPEEVGVLDTYPLQAAESDLKHYIDILWEEHGIHLDPKYFGPERAAYVLPERENGVLINDVRASMPWVLSRSMSFPSTIVSKPTFNDLYTDLYGGDPEEPDDQPYSLKNRPVEQDRWLGACTMAIGFMCAFMMVIAITIKVMR